MMVSHSLQVARYFDTRRRAFWVISCGMVSAVREGFAPMLLAIAFHLWSWLASLPARACAIS